MDNRLNNVSDYITFNEAFTKSPDLAAKVALMCTPESPEELFAWAQKHDIIFADLFSHLTPHQIAGVRMAYEIIKNINDDSYSKGQFALTSLCPVGPEIITRWRDASVSSNILIALRRIYSAR